MDHLADRPGLAELDRRDRALADAVIEIQPGTRISALSLGDSNLLRPGIVVTVAITKPDGRDMHVADIPFNWNANLDIKKLRVGYIKDSVDTLTNATAKANFEKSMAVMKQIGITNLVEVNIPEMETNVSAINRTTVSLSLHRAARIS